MNQKRILLALMTAIAVFLPCYAVCAAQDTPGAVKSYGTIVYEENDSKAKIYGDDFALLEEKVSSMPETAVEPALFSTPDSPLRAILMTRVYEEEAEIENEVEDQSDVGWTGEAGNEGKIEDGIAVDDAEHIEDGSMIENDTDAKSETKIEGETCVENRTDAKEDIVDGQFAEEKSGKGEERQVNGSISSNTMDETE